MCTVQLSEGERIPTYPRESVHAKNKQMFVWTFRSVPLDVFPFPSFTACFWSGARARVSSRVRDHLHRLFRGGARAQRLHVHHLLAFAAASTAAFSSGAPLSSIPPTTRPPSIQNAASFGAKSPTTIVSPSATP